MIKLFKKPRYIIEYVLFSALMKGLRTLGLERSANLCAIIAGAIGPYLKVTKVARKNIERALGSEADVDLIIKGLWDNFGRYIGEFPFIKTLHEEELDKRTKLEGFENIKPFINNRQPYFLYLAHLANWDFVISTLDKLYPKFSVVYRKANNPYVDKAVLNSRNSQTITMIAKGPSGAKGLANAIKIGSSIVMLVDQKMNDGISVPFFGRAAMTADAIAKLSLKYNYPIVPCQLVRTSGSNFTIILHPAIIFKATGNNKQDCFDIMLMINKQIEKWIRQHPDQWFWFHNRW